ncbi:MAG: hypothetical protein WCT32_02215 [Patescibacteria group bacterium]|jgi:hypothetical protein
MDISSLLTKFLLYPSHNLSRNLFALGVFLVVSAEAKSEIHTNDLLPVVSVGTVLAIGLMLILVTITIEMIFRSIVSFKLRKITQEIRARLKDARYQIVDHYYDESNQAYLSGRLILIDKNKKQYYWIKYGWTAEAIGIQNLWEKKTFSEEQLKVIKYSGVLEDQIFWHSF